MRPRPMPPMSTRAGRVRATRVVAVLGALVCFGPVVAACSQEEGRSAGAYCALVEERLPVLVDPPIATEADITATIDTYRELADRAPIAVAPEWERLVESLETAATVVASDPASVQRATDVARAATPAAVRVQQYTSSTCGVDLGSVSEPTAPPTTTAGTGDDTGG